MDLFSILLIVACIPLLWLIPTLCKDKGRRSLLMALRSLWLHKLRAFLSVLGIIIGTAAVIVLMSFGQGSMHDALEAIKRQGATNIILHSWKPPDDSTTETRVSFFATFGITAQDYNRLLALKESGAVTRLVPMRIFKQDVWYLDHKQQGRMVATTPQYTEVNQLEMAAGRFLTAEDEATMANVCTLGSALAEKLFPFEDPLDRTVRIKDFKYRVVGVVRERMPTGGAGGSQAAEDYNDDVYIPLSTSRGRLGDRLIIVQSGSRSGEHVYLNQVTLTVSDLDKVRPVGDIIRDMMQKAHAKDDWRVTVPLDKLKEAEEAKERFTGLLLVIGSISLIVGGIGIMNIMLATVTERTREIGIRRALGAKRKDITLQFLIEAVVQTATGGALGLLVGLGGVWVGPSLYKLITHTNQPAKIHVLSIFLSVGWAVVVGVLAGLYPAWRAAQLDPIEALRHE
jgi:putative ABC transport system permease protein